MGRFAALALLLVMSCDQSSNRVSTLWTNVPEIASAVERFNASQREWQLLVVYKEDPASVLTSPGVKADLVIARGLNSAPVKNSMVSLEFLFAGGRLAKAAFYHRGLDAGQQDGMRLLPLAFDLPVLVFARNQLPDFPGFSVTLSDLKALNQKFNAEAAQGQRRLAFSPRWGAFGPTFLEWSGAGFRETFQGGLGWNALGPSLQEYEDWPSPGWDEVTDFQRKYLQADPYTVLAAGRVQFYPTTLAAFMNRPWKERRDFDFRFLDVGGRALATESVVWAGIPSSSLTRGAGERFLAWFFQPDTQKALVEETRKQDDNFGLAQGISSLIATNTSSDVYPELAGRLPDADQVVFWPALPIDWTNLRTTVLRPWLEAPGATEASLKAALEKQRLQAERR